jgi:predicted transcriptional regulator
MSEQIKQDELLGYTTSIVSAHVANNPVPVGELPQLIREVFKTLTTMGEHAAPNGEKPTPAVPVRRSVTPDYLICLEDGRKLKMLKRHLKTAFGMTPEEYRERWGLPSNYPMVAPNYAKKRSKLAKEIGLGTRARKGR